MLMIFQYQMKICPNFHVSLPPSVIKEKVVFFLASQVAWRHACGHEQSSGPAALLVLHMLLGWRDSDIKQRQNHGAVVVEYHFFQHQHHLPPGTQRAGSTATWVSPSLQGRGSLNLILCKNGFRERFRNCFGSAFGKRNR